MLTMIVKADKRGKTQRITIPKIIRDFKKWDDVCLYKIFLSYDGVVTIEGYLNNDDLKK